MLRVLRGGQPDFDVAPAPLADWTLPVDAVWIDMCAPSRDEELLVEAFVGACLPTREEMVEIEPSSRLYREGPATVMTASVLNGVDDDVPSLEPITFVLVGERLVTIRYVEPKPFRVFAAQIGRQPAMFACGPVALTHLLEAIVDRVADILERVGTEVEAIGRKVFGDERPRKFEPVLTRLGRAQNIALKARESLVGLARIVSYCQLLEPLERNAEARELLISQERDVRSLTDHAAYVSQNIAFLLDATLGLINVEQNAIIKIFSVAAVAFLPPTLIASIYGMNFEHMPELPQPWGYPLALILMVVSAVLPLWWFRRRGWL